MEKIKKVTKALATIGLVGGIALSSVGNASAAQVHYKDVKKADNFYTSVEYLLSEDAISKTLPNFRPYENITRGQFASIFAKVLEERLDDVSTYDFWKKTDFKDVPNTHQFNQYVEKLVGNSIMGGLISPFNRGGGIFGVNESLTRGQMAGILVKAYRIPLINAEIYKENGGKVSDIFDGKRFKGQWGLQLATLEYLGVMSGYGDGSYKPNAPIKRSQFANMLYKIENNMNAIIPDNHFTEELNKLGVSEEAAIKSIKDLKDNNVINYIGSYDHYVAYETVDPHTLYFVMDIQKEGEVLLEDLNIKMIVSKSTYTFYGYDFTFEKVETQQPTAPAEDPTTENTNAE
ncbi:hypothetical protein JOD29_003426 [Lysinibacillus composti]|uniref:S-layer homology domain-containing protein n=1 Tax=Lysinibacillus composti TaxID=720633 RepID=A0A3N9U9D0_9BACI|nr:S-layer homology domain-containing protein [Lysinibacillus composti]MBM7610147.1 hypothetical protein [Lysinibacillus composti]RQW73208.1 S-layer homology domain-containing protein [Lysinibacillus composti]